MRPRDVCCQAWWSDDRKNLSNTTVRVGVVPRWVITVCTQYAWVYACLVVMQMLLGILRGIALTYAMLAASVGR